MRFVPLKGGDLIAVDKIALISADPNDPNVPDSARLIGTLTGGLGFNVSCGDLRRALAEPVLVSIASSKPGKREAAAS